MNKKEISQLIRKEGCSWFEFWKYSLENEVMCKSPADGVIFLDVSGNSISCKRCPGKMAFEISFDEEQLDIA